MSEDAHAGGCQCGAVRYCITGTLGNTSICHCRMCQKAFGSWGAALVSAPAARLEWTRGRPSEFRSSSIVARGFCRDCGTPLHIRDDGDPNYDVAIGTLDDPSAIPPMEHQVGIESEVSWFRTMHNLPRKMTTDYRSPEDMEKLKSLQHPDHDTEHWP